jgi:hypothetical protein
MVKARHTTFFHRVVGRTDALLTGIEDAGAPRVDDGVDYGRDLHTERMQTRTGLADVRARFAASPTGGLQGYATGSAKIRDHLGRVFAGVDAALDRFGLTYPDNSLNRAFDRQPDCNSPV